MTKPVALVIRVGSHGTPDTLREYAERRLSCAIRNFERRINRVTVRISDLNGPKGGVDAHCSIAADLNDGTRILAKATTAWPFASVKQAASRLSEALRREIKRTTQHRRHAVQHGGADIS